MPIALLFMVSNSSPDCHPAPMNAAEYAATASDLSPHRVLHTAGKRHVSLARRRISSLGSVLDRTSPRA